MEDRKRFTITIPVAQHTRLRELAKHFKLGQNYILAALISDADVERTSFIVEVDIARALRPGGRSAEQTISALTKTMSDSEKEEMRKRLGL